MFICVIKCITNNLYNNVIMVNIIFSIILAKSDCRLYVKKLSNYIHKFSYGFITYSNISQVYRPTINLRMNVDASLVPAIMQKIKQIH